MPNHPARIALKPQALREAINDHANGSRDQLARLICVDKTTAYRIESGQVLPSTKFIGGLIRVTGKPFEALFVIEDAA